MDDQDIPLVLISPPGSGVPHSPIGPGKVGSGVSAGAKTREGKEGEIDRIKKMAQRTDGSGPTHQRGREPEQPLTSDPELLQPPAAVDKQVLSGSASNGTRRAMNGGATRSQEPTDTTLVPSGDELATGGRVQQKAPPGLSQRAEFWERYDKLADIIDKKLSENLNGNLDVLLIFLTTIGTICTNDSKAALFSAINTTFISMTMSDLSPGPADKTNALLEHIAKILDNTTSTTSNLTTSDGTPFSPQLSSIAVNFLLYASLCCSLLAAMGAMLGKEWLQSFDRTGQTGLSEEQGRLRQSKFNGIQQWHLEGTILFLPNLLVFSVTLFFAGLAVYLFPINRAVAGLLIAVLGLALGVWFVTVLAGAISPLCPYQSAASRALRSVGLRVSAYRKRVRQPSGYHTKNSMGATLRKWKDSLMRFITRSPSNWLRLPSSINTHEEEAGNGEKITEEKISNAQAVGWLIETTSSRGDRLAAVKFIITFDDAGCESILQSQAACQRLLRLARESFESWQFQPTEPNREMVEGFGRALSRLVLFRPDVAAGWNIQADGATGQQRGIFESFVFGLEMAARRNATKETTKETDTDFLAHVAFLHALATTQNLYSKSRSWEKLLILMSTLDISLLDKRVTSACYNAAHALRSLQRSHSETNAIEIYSSFLQEIRHIATPDQLRDELASLLVYSVIEFIFDVHGSPNVNQVSSDHKLDKFSVESLLALRAIIPSDCLRTSSGYSILEKHWFDPKTPWRSPIRAWDHWKLEDYWRAFDGMMVKLGTSSPAIEKLAPDFALATVEWLALSLQLTAPLDGFEKHPHVVSSVITGLTDHRPRIQARWMQLFAVGGRGRPWRIPRSFVWWVDAGLGSKLAETLQLQTRGSVREVLEAFKTTNGEIPKEVLVWLWDTCDGIIAEFQSPKLEGQGPGPESVLELFEWLSNSLPEDQLMDGLENHRQIAAHISSSLAMETPESRARWLKLFVVNKERWFKPPLKTLWREVGLGTRLVVILRQPQTWDKGARVLDVVKIAIEDSFYWSKSLAHVGLPLAAAEAILHINKKRELLHPEWRNLLGRAVEIMLEAWNDTKDAPDIQWPTQEMLPVIRPSSAHIKRLLEASDVKIADVLRFVQLIKYLQEHLPLSAFIACNADIAVRSVFAKLKRRAEVIYPLQSAYEASQQIIWDYEPYGLSDAASVCSRPYVFDEQLVL
ncbi:hypothetical protein FRC04_009775 [Tulasnella sp. 424]|nr:hypothetical protein FRC04_009775 [Tulasnella sp. 424]KAG8971145.1 hypothetical protein FRC05_011429 [Tulasnella sp. 425]